LPDVAVPARARLLTDWCVGEADWDKLLFSDESGLDEDSEFQDSDQDSDLQVPRGAAAPLAGVPVEGLALFSWEPLAGAPPFSWASSDVVAPISQLNSQVAWSEAVQEEDVEFVLDEVPQEVKEADPYYRAAVKSAIDDDQFEMQIEDIERCSVTKELLYRIRYRNGDQEYLTADDVHWLAQATGFAQAAQPRAVQPGAGGAAVHPEAVHPGAGEGGVQPGAGAADETAEWADAAAEAAACAGAAAATAAWHGAAAKMAECADAATGTAGLTGAAAEAAKWAGAAIETVTTAFWEPEERELRQELVEGLEDLHDDEPDVGIKEEREGIKFQMLQGIVKLIEALPRGSVIFEELQGTLGDEASVILAEVRAGGCWTAARACSVREKVTVRASEVFGRAAGQLAAAG